MYEGARERREAMGEQWPPLDPDLPRRIGERVMKRAIAVLRRERRGRTILGVPLELTNELGAGNPNLDIRYRFAEADARRRFFDVMVSRLRLALVHGGSGSRPLSWDDFESATDDELAALDEALFEFAHLIADLAAVDGAVVLE
jgi:hypothetical protein